MKITGPAQKQAWTAGQLPPVEQVRPGLWSIPVPIPDNPLRCVLVYAFETTEGLVVVDAGWDDESAWAALLDGLTATGHTPADIAGIVVTHMHPDHFGLAPRLRTASGAWLAMHPADEPLVRRRSAEEEDRWWADSRAQVVRMGGAPELLASAGSVPIPRLGPGEGPERLLEDGADLRVGGLRLQIIHTPGHTPGHICLLDRDRGVLLTGDHVLPRITPYVPVLPGQLVDPLGEYLAALRRVAVMEPDEVLPAHEYRFSGLSERVEQMLAHHEERLEEVLDAVRRDPDITTAAVCRRLHWSRPFDAQPHHLQRMALRETLAHLVLLRLRGQVVERDGNPSTWSAAQGHR